MSEPLRLPGPALVVLVGPAGAGKSTWAAEHFDQGAVVSSDRLRGQVGRGEWDQEASADAFALLEEIVRMRLGRRLTTVIDSTGLDRDDRRRWVGMAHAAGLDAVAVTFPTDPAECKERNRRRPDPVPAAVLDGQLRRFRETLSELDDDGFDRIVEAATVSIGRAAAVKASAERAADAPTGLRFGLALGRFPWPDSEIGPMVAEVARAAERAGFDTLWTMDHLRQIPQVGRAWDPLPEAYVTLTHVAAVTERLRVGALVTNVVFRNVGLLGKMVATLDVLSGGRARCGLGAGWFAAEAEAFGYDFPPPARRLDLLEDALQALPLVWGPGSKSFTGKVISVPDTACYPRPLQERIPVLVGGSGRRTLRLAATHADACNLMGGADAVAAGIETLREHCAAVGRDPTEVAVTHLGEALAAPDRATLDRFIEEARPPRVSAAEFADRVASGTTDVLVDYYRSLANLGVSEFMVGLPEPTPERVEAFGAVIAALGGSRV